MNTASAIISYCPACSRVLPFSEKTNLVNCSCGKVFFRNESGTLETKSYSVIEQAGDVLQPGTTGKWNGKSFTITGRIRIITEEYALNLWTTRFQDGEIRLLEEGYGLYAVLEPAVLKKSFTSKEFDAFRIGQRLPLSNEANFLLEEKEDSVKIETEGESALPYAPDQSRFADFTSDAGENFTILEWKRDLQTSYATAYQDFSAFEFSNLRKTNYKGYTFNCSDCMEKITVKTYPYATSCACPKCGNYYFLQPGKGFQKNKKRKLDFKPVLPIGSTGQIHDIPYEVIGCIQKEEDNSYHSKWREYTLYNPQEGYAFLSEYEGHWIYVREKGNVPVLYNEEADSFDYANETFVLYNAYNYKVNYASGEFPYNAFDNTDVKCKEYISPPEMWIKEKSTKEGISWFFAEYISKKEIESSFQPINELPRRIGVGAIQPKGYMNFTKLALSTLIAIFALVLIHIAITTFKQNRVLFNETINLSDTVNTTSVVTEKFKLDKYSSNLKLSIEAPVDNSWVEVSANLVNAETGKEYSLEKGVEYYHGYSEGESWSEGSTMEDAYFTSIPRGTYFLQIQGTKDSLDKNVHSFSVTATYDVENMRNLGFCLLLILAWAVGKYYLDQMFERERWYNSPFTTFDNED